MARHPKRAQVVGGFDTLRAAQRAKKVGGDRGASETAPAEPSAGPPRGGQRIAARIDHTALPTKHEIMCYECGYEFALTGRTPTTHCPKCRKLLEIKDHTIDGASEETIKTAGTIRVTAQGTVVSGVLRATDIVLEGHAEGGTLEAYRWLELGPKATFAEGVLKSRDLRVAAGAGVILKRKANYRNVEIYGSLKAKLHAEGRVTVKAGGSLQGEVYGGHLVVEEGGGLKAKVRVEGPAAEADELQKSA